MTVCGITRALARLSPTQRQVAHVLRTRSPVGIAPPRDLHVLSTPPAFVLSQDQTLQEILIQLDESNSCLTLSRGQRVRIIEYVQVFELGSSGPCRPASYFEFASHILIPLSIVKQRYALRPPRFHGSLEL